MISFIALLSSPGDPRVARADGPVLAIDADISDGACVDIDASATVPLSQSSLPVAICFENPGEVPASAFEYSIIYDDTKITVPEIADQAPSLDDNPDANAGSTTFTTATHPETLGSGWTCEGGVGADPVGDKNPLTGPGNGEAYSGGCGSPAGPNTLVDGPLGVVTFDLASTPLALPVSLTLTKASVTDDSPAEIGSCAPVLTTPMTCVGATITKIQDLGLYLDLDTADGTCTGVQTSPTRSVNPGTAFDVAICLKNKSFAAEGIIAMNFRVAYDDRVVYADEVADSGTGVDDNPDASPGLPAAWECDNAYPVADFDSVPWNGSGEARSSCLYVNNPNPPVGALFEGAFALIHFTAGAPGSTSLSYALGQFTAWGSSFNQTYTCPNSAFCFGGTITVPCVQPDAECDGADDGSDNCLGLYNPDQRNTDSDPRDNGPLAAGNDETSMTTDAVGDACDADDDNDGITDADEVLFPVPGCPNASAALDPLKIDTDGDHLTDAWECAAPPSLSDPANAALKYMGNGSNADADGDHIIDQWEMRGYNGSGGNTDSDGDGCWDMVEVTSVDGGKAVGDADRIAVARRALGIWPPHASQDYVFDINKNGAVDDTDRIFVARAALLPTWTPKSCP